MLELWGVNKLRREGGTKVKIGDEEIGIEEDLEILYGIANIDPAISKHVAFKIPRKLVLPGKMKTYEFWFHPDLIIKVKDKILRTLPKDLKYSLYGGLSEGLIVRRINVQEDPGREKSKLLLKIKNETTDPVEISRVVFPIRYLEGGRKCPEEFSITLLLRIKGNKVGEVEMVGYKRARYEMLWGFS